MKSKLSSKSLIVISKVDQYLIKGGQASTSTDTSSDESIIVEDINEV